MALQLASHYSETALAMALFISKKLPLFWAELYAINSRAREQTKDEKLPVAADDERGRRNQDYKFIAAVIVYPAVRATPKQKR